MVAALSFCLLILAPSESLLLRQQPFRLSQGAESLHARRVAHRCSQISMELEDAARTEKPISPQAAMEELSSLLEQVKLLWTEGSSWSVEERADKRRTLVETYVRVFAPALAFSAVQLGLGLSVFLFVLLALNLSGRGYNDIAGACT
jgi:hypothetical protein